jgi:4,5-DOPA dioxygenase extradiol
LTESSAPLFVALGASLATGEAGETVIDGFFMGLSKRSVQFG